MDRKQHRLHCYGNHELDRHKFLSFDLKTQTVIKYHAKLSTFALIDLISFSFLIDFGFDKRVQTQLKSLDRISSQIVLKEKWPISNYKRYLFVPSLQILLRFGGEHGVDNSVEYISVDQAVKSKAKMCKNWNRNKAENRCVFGNKCWFKHGDEDCRRIANVKWRKYGNVRLPGESALSMHFVLGYDHLLYVFDVKGGGNGKIWIIDLLFAENRIERALKSMDSDCARWDYVAKISENYVRFINASRYGELMISLADVMPPSMIKYYDEKCKALVNGFCRQVEEFSLSSNFHICLIGLIFSFYEPFF